jgi:hypothetical protein
MATMETHDALDDLTDDERVAAHRERAKAKLNQIAQQTRQALTQQGMDTSVYFLVPHSGDAIVTFGTAGDPSDDEWNRVAEIVSSIVRQTVGLDRTRCREVMCATTADHQPPQPIPAPLTAHQEASADEHSDIISTAGGRFQLPPSHPYLTEIDLDPVNWDRLQQMTDDNPATQIVGHDDPADGLMTVYVACASGEVRNRLRDGWD